MDGRSIDAAQISPGTLHVPGFRRDLEVMASTARMLGRAEFADGVEAAIARLDQAAGPVVIPPLTPAMVNEISSIWSRPPPHVASGAASAALREPPPPPAQAVLHIPQRQRKRAPKPTDMGHANKRWTQADDQQLRELWPEELGNTLLILSSTLGRTENAIGHRARLLGLPARLIDLSDKAKARLGISPVSLPATGAAEQAAETATA